MTISAFKSISTNVALGSAIVGAVILGSAVNAVWAEEDETPFTVGELFFQLNDTDGDLGIHARIDGEPWTRLVITDFRERRILDVRLRGRLRLQGLTEFKFESAEPPFEEFSPEEFFRRFPEGEYEIEGRSADNRELESEVMLTHVMPDAPRDLSISGQPAPDDCDDGPVPILSGPLLVRWSPVTRFHPDIGRAGPVQVVGYEVDVERDEPTPLKLTFSVSGDVNEVEVPSGLLGPGDEVKFQVLAADIGGNESSSESCFEVL